MGTRSSKKHDFRKLKSIVPSYCLKAPPPLKNAPRRKSAEPHSEEPECQRTSFLWGRSRNRTSKVGQPLFSCPLLRFGRTAGVQQRRPFRNAQCALGRRLARRWPGSCGAAAASRAHGATHCAESRATAWRRWSGARLGPICAANCGRRTATSIGFDQRRDLKKSVVRSCSMDTVQRNGGEQRHVLKGPLVDIAVRTWWHVLDGPTFSPWPTNRHVCVHPASFAGRPNFFSKVS